MVAAPLATTALVALLAVPAVAQGDLDCEDFATREQAQDVLDADRTDPNNLDSNGNGLACENLPAPGTPNVAPAPAGGVAAGGGGTAQAGPSGTAVGLTVAGVVSAAAVGAGLRTRRG